MLSWIWFFLSVFLLPLLHHQCNYLANAAIQPQTFTQSPYSLRSITTTLSEFPVTLIFGQVPCGADRVSVKNRSENRDCTLCSVTELADLPDAVMALVIAEVKKKTGVFLLILHDILHDPCHYLADVQIQPQTRSHNLRTRCGP